jgi:hypothetical protein
MIMQHVREPRRVRDHHTNVASIQPGLGSKAVAGAPRRHGSRLVAFMLSGQSLREAI